MPLYFKHVKSEDLPTITILGVRIDCLDNTSAIRRILELIKRKKTSYAVTVNPEFIVTAQEDAEFKAILNRSDISLPDGIGLVYAAYLLRLMNKSKHTFNQTVPGIDMLVELSSIAANLGLTVFFLGGRDGVAKKTAQRLQATFANLSVAGYFEGEGDETGDSETSKAIITAAHKIGADIDVLFIAYGHPKQEKWLSRNLEKLPVRFALGVGGSLDVLSGHKRAVPSLLKRLGLDWFWRLVNDPGRLPRIYRAVVVFPLRVFISCF